ncbi:MAG: ketopantoate reductase family protein [Spirochaetales bacterium]
MKLAVIGAGPVGQTLAGRLIEGGHDVTMVEVNAELRDRLAGDGIRLSGAHELFAPVRSIVPSIDALAGLPFEIVFVAVKATATELVASAIGDTVRTDATVVSWQNGIDTERALETHVAGERIVRAVINHGVSIAESGAVTVTFEHPPHLVRELAPAGAERARIVSVVLSGAGLATERAENLESAVWQKSSLNAALNAICALTGLAMHDVWHDGFAGELARKVLKESIAVARANEIFLGSDFYRNSLAYLSAAGNHKPSMLLDREAGRRTEIDFINGKIIEYGQMAGMATPFNEALVALVKSAERSTRERTTAGES